MAPSSRLRVRVVPGARSAGVVGRHGSAWKVRVAAPAERGRANDALVELLAASLGVSPSAVKLVAGAGSRDKVIEVHGVSADQAERLLVLASERGAN